MVEVIFIQELAIHIFNVQIIIHYYKAFNSFVQLFFSVDFIYVLLIHFLLQIFLCFGIRKKL